MNWQKGLLRVWIVASLAWAVAAFFMIRPYVYYQSVMERPIYVQYNGGEIAFPNSLDSAGLEAALSAYIARATTGKTVPGNYATIMKSTFDQFNRLSTNDLINELKSADARGDIDSARAAAAIIGYRTREKTLSPFEPPANYLQPLSPDEAARMLAKGHPLEPASSRQWRALENWRAFLLASILVPALLLTVGLVMRWILKGFRVTM